jgi:hypothetical protein
MDMDRCNLVQVQGWLKRNLAHGSSGLVILVQRCRPHTDAHASLTESTKIKFALSWHDA